MAEARTLPRDDVALEVWETDGVEMLDDSGTMVEGHSMDHLTDDGDFVGLGIERSRARS